MDKKITKEGKLSIDSVYHKLIPFTFLLILIFFFFFRLFFGKNSIFMIPDFGESDVLHLNYPLKEILSVSLKNKEWPLWTQLLASGFPILAEGQIGTFYLPNLVLFRFLPTIISYNLNLVIAFFLSSMGMYLLIRQLHLSRLTASFASIIFTYSGFMSVHLNHFNLIQAVSLLPLIFWSFILLLKRDNASYIILFAFILSQQIFTGHFYMVFITLIGIFIYGFLELFLNKIISQKQKWKKIAYCLLGLELALILSAIQLLPTLELWHYSSRNSGLDYAAITSYPYPIKHLITFIKPYFFGDPGKGTYPIFSSNWGIFWENTSYIGILPLILALISIFYLKFRVVKIFWGLLIISLLLVSGKYSPLYFIFSFPPFNFFRVPSKFLLLTTISLSILSGYSLERLINWLQKPRLIQIRAIASICIRKTILNYSVIFLIFLLVILDEYRFSYNYPPVSRASDWFEIPQAADILPKNTNFRIASIGAENFWNSIFLSKGWQDLKPFSYFRNSLYPNYNAIYQIPQADVNTGGLIPRRTSLFKSLIKDVNIDEGKNEASISALTRNSLSISNVKYLISPYNITDNKTFTLINTIEAPQGLNLKPFQIYLNNEVSPRSYISFNTFKVVTTQDLIKKLSDEQFLKDKITLVENDSLLLPQLLSASGSAEIISSSNSDVLLKTNSSGSGILILADTNYPGWKASLDDKLTEIYYVNLNSRGILLPSGQHIVHFSYNPKSFFLGKEITVLGYLITSLAVFLVRFFSPRKVFGNN